MKNWNADAIAALLFGIFMITVITIAFLSDAYMAYLPHHTFQVQYSKNMECRSAIALDNHSITEYIEDACGPIPRWEDYSK